MFKVGDKVRCISSEIYQSITVGRIYEIKKNDENFAYLTKNDIGMVTSNYIASRFEKVEEDNMFTKDNLVSGDSVVKTRDGRIFLYVLDGFINVDKAIHINNYHDSLFRYENGIDESDIMNVYKPRFRNSVLTFTGILKEQNLKLVWTRKEKTEAEKQLDELDKKIAELQEQAENVRKSMQDE